MNKHVSVLRRQSTSFQNSIARIYCRIRENSEYTYNIGELGLWGWSKRGARLEPQAELGEQGIGAVVVEGVLRVFVPAAEALPAQRELERLRQGIVHADAQFVLRADLVQAGVVNPAKVVRTALQNAASIAGLILTTECLVSEKKEEKPAAPAGGPGGGMGGMY